MNYARLLIVIAQLETGSCKDPDSVKNKDCWGRYQMKAGIVADYNRRHGTSYTHDAALNRAQATVIAADHLAYKLKRRHGTQDEQAQVVYLLNCWRWGEQGAKQKHPGDDYAERGWNLWQAQIQKEVAK